jgi:hypothetical protein
MNWSGLANSLTPLVVPLTILAASWTLQGWILVKPRKKKEIGEAILKRIKWFWGFIIFLTVLIAIFDQLALHLK